MGKTPIHKVGGLGHDTKMYLIVKPLFWMPGEYGVSCVKNKNCKRLHKEMSIQTYNGTQYQFLLGVYFDLNCRLAAEIRLKNPVCWAIYL